MIRRVLIALACLGSAYSLPYNPRIVNGTDADIREYPYIVSLRSYGSHSCGSSIIAPEWILTAAHCVLGSFVTSLSIQYGVTNITSTELNEIKVQRVITHKEYVPSGSYPNDVALLKLESPIPINGKTIGIMNLPEQGFEVPGGDMGKLIGWGYEKTGGSVQTHLQQVDLKIYSDEECNSRHQGETTVHHICGGVDEGGKGQCSGDSGGPLIYKNVQVGIVSWSRKPCTIAPYPGVFTKVSHYVKWIKKNMRKYK